MHSLDFHVKSVNQCRLGGDMDHEKKPILNYATISLGFYLLWL